MIGNKIKQLRKDCGMTQAELGKKLGVIKQTVSSWETGVSEPSNDTVREMAAIFNVSLDFLMGNSSSSTDLSKKCDENSLFFFDDLLRDVFSSRCNDLLREKHLSVNSLADVTGIDAERCRKYLQGECEPSLEDLISIAQALETTTDYLLGQTPKVTYYENKILGPFVKLNADNKDILIGKAKELLREQEVAVAADSQPLRKASGK